MISRCVFDHVHSPRLLTICAFDSKMSNYFVYINNN